MTSNESPELSSATFEAPRDPFFDYIDLCLFLGLCLPGILIALGVVRVAKFVVSIPTGIQLMLVQGIWYFLIFGALAALFRIRYDRPFWRSLGWRPLTFGTAMGALAAGPVLAISVGLLGSAIRIPDISLPFEQMLGSQAAVALLGFVVVILGPVAEELAFRGLMMPLLIRSLGVVSGVVVTGLLFGVLHGSEYHWSWGHVLLISAAGSIFGWIKYRTQSTAAAAFMHSTYNLTQFAAFLAQSHSL